MKNRIFVEPSLLAADFGCLAKEVERVEKAGADALHIDIMDGHFVKNFSMGPSVVAAMRRSCDLFLDVHLMVYNPFSYVENFVEAGANRITIHLEATEEVEETLRYIRSCNVEAGLAICPETSVSLLPRYLPLCDLALLMTVNPGFGGQAFLPEVVEKIETLRGVCSHMGLDSFKIQVDGGIDDKTAPVCIGAGANVLVSGTYLFAARDLASAIATLRGA